MAPRINARPPPSPGLPPPTTEAPKHRDKCDPNLPMDSYRVSKSPPPKAGASKPLSQDLQGVLGLTKRLDRAVTKNPKMIDRVLATKIGAKQKSTFAKAVSGGFIAHGAKNEKFRSHKNFTRMVKLLEAVDPKATKKDITRALRRRFYPDSKLTLGNMGMGGTDPTISKDLRGILDRQKANLKEGWQEVVGPDGKKVDVAHSLVALDADIQSGKGVRGRIRAWTFTHFGDWASGVLSKLGIGSYGNNNGVDKRGNDFGDQLLKTNRGGRFDKLSDLLRYNFLGNYLSAK